MACEHEWQLKSDGWEEEINLSLWSKEGEEDLQIHFHTPSEMGVADMDKLIDYLQRERVARFPE